MTDARVKEVLPVLADIYSRQNYLLDRFTPLNAALGKGESIDLPSIGSYTVTADGDTGITANAAPSISTTVDNLIVDKLPTIFAKIAKKERIFNLGDGSWGRQVGMIAGEQLRASIDDSVVEYLIGEPGWDTSATYHVNQTGATLTSSMLREALAKLRENDGMHMPEWWVSPYGEASISQIADFVPNQVQADSGNFGVRQIGTLFGAPVISSNSIVRNRSVATSAVTVATNVATATVAAGHGLVAGQQIYTTGLTTNVASTAKVAITSVTATTVVYPLTAGDGALADGVGLIVTSTSPNLLVDRAHIFAAQFGGPEVEVIPLSGTLQDEMKVWALYGRKARSVSVVPSVYVVHSPGGSVT